MTEEENSPTTPEGPGTDQYKIYNVSDILWLQLQKMILTTEGLLLPILCTLSQNI